MRPQKKSLQKFTKTETKINKLLKLEQITDSDMEIFSSDERKQFFVVFSERLGLLKGIERDNFLLKIEKIISDNGRNSLWEHNHHSITGAISNLMVRNNIMPTIHEIVNETGLSRQTIHKHLNEYAAHPLYLCEIERYRFMTARMIALVFQYALKGDMSAAKLYFKVTGALGENSQNSNNTLIQNQNNYIQINGTVLSQEKIKMLNPVQLEKIELLLKEAFTD